MICPVLHRWQKLGSRQRLSGDRRKRKERERLVVRRWEKVCREHTACMREFETLEVTRPLLVVAGGFTDMCVLYDSLCFKKGLEKERGGR